MRIARLTSEERKYVVRDTKQLRAEGHTWRDIKRHLHVAYGVCIGHKRMKQIVTEPKPLQ